jgi:hypothetical protein
MKKVFLILFLFLGFFPAIHCQKVDSLKTEQSGDVIKIHYKIINSNPNQVFKVTVMCSINGGLQSVLKSLSGDFGDNVVGGRSDYMVLWDVLKDVDEVKTVDFSIKAELVKGEPQTKEAKKREPLRKIHAMVLMDTKAQQFGPRLGFMGKWGVTLSFISGGVLLKDFFPNNPTLTDESVPYNVFTLDLTKSIIKKNKFQLHAMAGVATTKKAGDKYASYFQDYSKRYTGFNAGLVMDYGMLAISVEMTSLPKFLGTSSLNTVFFGLGMRF